MDWRGREKSEYFFRYNECVGYLYVSDERKSSEIQNKGQLNAEIYSLDH